MHDQYEAGKPQQVKPTEPDKEKKYCRCNKRCPTKEYNQAELITFRLYRHTDFKVLGGLSELKIVKLPDMHVYKSYWKRYLFISAVICCDLS